MIKRINPVQYLFLFACALALAACASFAKPQSPQDYLQTAKAQVGAAYKTVGDLKAQGSIDTATGVSYFNKIQSVETQVNAAGAVLTSGDGATAQTQLQLALSALLAIQTELNAHKK